MVLAAALLPNVDLPASPVQPTTATIISLDAHREPRPEPRAGNDGARRLGLNTLGPMPADDAFDPPANAATVALLAEQRRLREIHRSFSQHPAPGASERLIADPRAPRLSGETRELTVLFADIRGFTAMSETLKDDPQQLHQVINGVLGPLSDIVVAHGGAIDKYMGDCIMAYWGAPLDDPDHARNAVAAAEAMLAAMDDINAAIAAALPDVAALPPIRIGIGVNSGLCVLGAIGSLRHFNYSVVGDPVNIASRLVGLTKTYDLHLLIGEGTARLLPAEIGRREVDRIAVRGRTECQGLFALSAGEDISAQPATAGVIDLVAWKAGRADALQAVA